MPTTLTFDPTAVRADFPALDQHVNGQRLVYLDNAATSQKPRQVIDAITAFYAGSNSNVHRGVHTLSQQATDLYEAGRRSVQRFLNAEHEHEVIYTRGTTEAINLVADTLGRTVLKAGDEVIVTEMEHHSNLVPWHMAC
ncbi:MAG: aminotransferase class V-fold PLP-dependent enzyme, partial [Bacteroidota bacterium]